MKPISEIMPENPINTVTPILQMVGVKAATGGQKYDTENIVKIVPRRIVVDGRIKHKCSACEFEKVSWGAVNTHIMKVHVGPIICLFKVCKNPNEHGWSPSSSAETAQGLNFNSFLLLCRYYTFTIKIFCKY